MVQATYAGEAEFNNTKGLIFTLGFNGVYGINGVGDLVNLAPYEQGTNPTGVLDPKLSYNLILAEPSDNIGIFNENIGGYYTQLTPNASPTLANLGVRVFSPGGIELATGAAYPAAVTGGSVKILAFVGLQ